VSIDPKIIREVTRQTEVLRSPKQSLATFGITDVAYYLVSEPAYADLVDDVRETVIRRGRVTAERPQLVTPYYLLNLFQGFDHGREYAQYLAETYGPRSPGLLYSYRNELHETTILADPLPVVANRLAEMLEKEGRALAAVIKGVDHLWDISLMKFIYELTVGSLERNVDEMGRRGWLGMDRGLPRGARARLEEMFAQVAAGNLDPRELKRELDSWGVFEEYEDRFLGLFRHR